VIGALASERRGARRGASKNVPFVMKQKTTRALGTSENLGVPRAFGRAVGQSAPREHAFGDEKKTPRRGR